MRHFIHILYIILAMGLGLPVGGCVNDYADEGCGVADVPDKVKVRFTLQLDDFGGSRAGELSGGVWNNDYTSEIGTRFDSQINRLHVMLIEDATDNVAHVMLDRCEYVADDGGYTFEGYLDMSAHKLGAGAYHVMVLANCGPAELGIAKKEYLRDAIDHVGWYNPDGSRISGRYIPMWGTAPVTLKLDGEAPEDIGSIDLLRAVAKVRIMLTDKMKEAGYTLQSATISHANAYIDPLPAGWDKAGLTTDNGQRHGAPFNPVATHVTPKEFIPITTSAEGDDKAGTIVFYLPEYDSAPTAGGEATIDVTLRHEATGQTLTYPAALKFDDPDINSGGTGGAERLTTDIVRNHLYHFTIEGIDFGTLNYRVACWNHITSTLGWNVGNVDFEFGDGDRGNSDDAEAKHGIIEYPCYEKESKKDKFKDDSSFADYFFKLKSPEGAVWKAFLVEDGVEYPATGDYEFVNNGKTSSADTPNGFYFGTGNDDKNNQRAVSSGIQREDPYFIKIGTRSQWQTLTDNKTLGELTEEGKKWKESGTVPEVYLIIRISLDGMNYSEPLPINPPKPSKNALFKEYEFAGSATHIQLRHLYLPKLNGEDMSERIKGTAGKMGTDAWWGLPIGHKDIPEATPTE